MRRREFIQAARRHGRRWCLVDQCMAGAGGLGCSTPGPSYRADCGRSVIRGGGAGVYGTHDLLSTSLSNSWSM